MPKITVDTTYPFPATPQEYYEHEFEKPVKKPAAKKTVAKKTVRKKA